MRRLTALAACSILAVTLAGCAAAQPKLTRDEWLECAKAAVNVVLDTESGRERLLDLSETEAKRVMLEIGVDACGEAPID